VEDKRTAKGAKVTIHPIRAGYGSKIPFRVQISFFATVTSAWRVKFGLLGSRFMSVNLRADGFL